jgi:hypothetical protein
LRYEYHNYAPLRQTIAMALLFINLEQKQFLLNGQLLSLTKSADSSKFWHMA